jgi:hypothetical protein
VVAYRDSDGLILFKGSPEELLKWRGGVGANSPHILAVSTDFLREMNEKYEAVLLN